MNKELINTHFKIVINSYGIIKKYSKNAKKLFKNIKKDEKISNILSPESFNLFFDSLNSFKNQKLNEKKSLQITTVNNKKFNITITEIDKNLFQITFKSIKNNNETNSLDHLSNKLKDSHDKQIHHLAVNICNYISKNLQLTNLFVFNYQNFYSIRYWDISSDYNAHFMDNRDLKFINKLQQYIYYNYLSSEKIDEKLDLLFSDNSYNFITLDQLDGFYDEFPLIVVKYLKEIINFCKENRLTEIVLIPIIIKDLRIGFICILKNDKFTKSEKVIFYDIKQYTENLIQNSEFFKNFLEEIEDVNNLKIKLPEEIFKRLYFSLINMNKINNVHELKSFSRKELKDLTNSDFCSYYEINLNTMMLTPELIDEKENISAIIKKQKLSMTDPNIKKIIKIKRITFYNSSDEEKGLFIYPDIKEKNSYMFCPLYFTSNNPTGLFILTKKDNKKFNYLESIIVNTFFNHAQKKHRELLLIKENLDSKIKYKALYETILNLNLVNSSFNTFDIIAKIASNLVSSETVILYKIERDRHNPDKKFLSCVYSNEKIETRIKTLKEKIELGKYLIGKCCLDGITRFQNIEDYDPALDSCSDKKPKSILAIPLQIREEIMGGMVLIRYSHTNFDSNDLETILPFAQQAINIVYQNILIQSNIDKQETYKNIIEFIKLVNSESNVKILLKEILQYCFKLSPHSSKTGFFIYNKNKNKLKLFHWLSKINIKTKENIIYLDINSNIIKDCIHKRTITILTNEDINNISISEMERVFFNFNKFYFMFVPIFMFDKFIGIIYLAKSNTEKNSKNDDIKISTFLENVIEIISSGTLAEKIKSYLKYF